MLHSITSNMTTTQPGVSPPEFTQLVMAVMELALKAVGRADPVNYIEDQAVRDTEELRRLRSVLVTQGKLEVGTAQALRCEMLQVQLSRDGALHLLDCFRRLQRAHCLSGRLAQCKTPHAACTGGHGAA
jgi:hypothetical protein